MNQVIIKPTKFVDVRTNEETFGYRMYDTYANTYDNNWDDIPDDDMEILRRVKDTPNDETQDIITHVVANQDGVHISEKYYDWDIVKTVWT